jgi:transcriptional regulator with XRE-family HTH domain
MKTTLKDNYANEAYKKFIDDCYLKMSVAKRRLGMTNNEIAEITGLTPVTVSNIITGKASSLQSIIAVLHCLDMDLKARNREGFQERRREDI